MFALRNQFLMLLILGFSSLNAMLYKCNELLAPNSKTVLLLNLANRSKAGSPQEQSLTDKILALIRLRSAESVDASMTLGLSQQAKEPASGPACGPVDNEKII